MDWNFLAMEEGVEGDGNYYMQPHPNTVSVMSSENLVDVIPIEQGSNVVFRTLEGISAGAAGVEIIQFLEEGQQTMHLVEGINALPAGITEEEILAQLQAQQHSIPSANHTETSSTSRPADDQNMVNMSENNVIIMDNVQEGQTVTEVNVEGEVLTAPMKASYEPQTVKDSFTKQESDVCPSDSVTPAETQSPAVVGELVRDEPVTVSNSNQPFENLQEPDMVKSDDGKTEQPQTSLLSESKNPSLCSPESKSGRQEKADISVMEPASPTFKVPPSPQVTKVLSSQVCTAEPKSGTGTPHKATLTVFETVPECPKDVPMIIEILDDDDDDEGLLDDVPEEIDYNNYISSDEEDEAYKIQVENARALHRVKQAVDATAASYRPRFVSRVKLGKRHPRCKNLSFTEILKQTIIEDKILPDFNEQIIPRKIADKLRVTGHSLHKAADGGFMVSSKKRNVKCYHSSFSARFEPVLADPVLENYVQEYRKMLEFGMWRKSLRLGRKEVSGVHMNRQALWDNLVV